MFSCSHLVHFVLPETKSAGTVFLKKIADNDGTTSIAPELAVQEVSLLLTCCVPDLQRVDAESACTEGYS